MERIFFLTVPPTSVRDQWLSFMFVVQDSWGDGWMNGLDGWMNEQIVVCVRVCV